ncbi:caspase family protein [Pelagibius sp.]|uniref:caspase family protein n=1 Tax=Pelagibius sp. TaxID=1931238 RepID=UPI003BB141A2
MRRALLVGIDEYPAGSLQGCVNDTNRMASVLSTHDDGSRNFDCRRLVASAGSAPMLVTRSILRQAIEDLFRAKADVALLHFSGHGTVNDLDGYLVTQDAEKYDEGVAMSEVLRLASNSQVSEVVVFLDCCYSGNLGNPPDIDNARAVLREGLSVLTASRGDEPSVEAGGGGVFTSLVVDALNGGGCRYSWKCDCASSVLLCGCCARCMGAAAVIEVTCVAIGSASPLQSPDRSWHFAEVALAFPTARRRTCSRSLI